jgi:hypothetical protein
VGGVPLSGVRALLDAFIVRGRKRGDNLILPKAGAFASTLVDDQQLPADSLDPEEMVPFDAIDEPKPPKPPVTLPAPAPPAEPLPPFVIPRIDTTDGDAAPVTPAATATPPLKTRRRPRRSDPAPFGDLPELNLPSFGFDEAPIMPDPPPPRATYEDNDGPPLPL